MERPLEGITAVVLGTGPDLPADRLRAFHGCFTIAVNRLWKAAPGFEPTFAFWIDGGIYAERPRWFDRTLCVCDRSAAAGPAHIGLPMRPGPLPPTTEGLDPRVLYHRPNTGVVAALWAAALGCWPVVLLGMGCEGDGRRDEQIRPMRAALAEALEMDYRRPGDWRNALWPWPRWAVESPCVWASYTNSPRLRGFDGDDVRRRLRAFYAADDRNRQHGTNDEANR